MQIKDALTTRTVDALNRELLLAHILKQDRAWILAHPEYALADVEEERFRELVGRRESHEPLAYIIGEKEFYGRSFNVNRATLIPRPETELLVEHAAKHITNFVFPHSKRIAVVDVGTGSGCIIISLVRTLLDSGFKIQDSNFVFFATDISEEALAIARENATRHEVADQITFVQSDIIENLRKDLATYDTLHILANLPYLSKQLYEDTAPTVRNFEPATALVSGLDGLDHYRRLLSELAPLAEGREIRFLLEISPEQASSIPALLESQSAKLETLCADLASRDRLVIGSW